MDAKQHAEFTGAPADIDPEAGGAFSCHAGHVLGRYVELIPNQRIVQAWRIKDWLEGVYSVVRIDLIEQGSETKLILEHTAVPDDKRAHIETGWHLKYWEPLRKYVE
jgi:activator of HSP90 ATPase